MKKLTLTLAGLALAGAALAQATGSGFTANPSAMPATPAMADTARGGFTGPMTIVTAEQAKALQDDAKVTLRGNIESHLGGKNYMFKDASGSVVVEIKEKHWAGQSVAPQDTVQIDGEVDRDHNMVTVETENLKKL